MSGEERGKLREYRAALRADPATARSVRNLGIFVVLEQILFTPLDFQVFGDAFGLFLPLRVFVLLSAAYIWLRVGRTHPIESSIFMELASGATVLAMIAYDGGVTSRYSPGLMLVFCALPVFAPLSLGQVSASVLPSLLVFLGLPLFSQPSGAFEYALGVAFPLSGAMIAIGSTWVLDQVRFTEFLRRRELEEARDHLKALDATKSRFAANVHHELRTPLTLILAPLEAMLEKRFGAVPGSFQTHLDSMRSNALRLLRLINNLLDLAKLESNQMRLARRPLDLAELLEQSVRHASGLAESKGLLLELRIAEALPVLHADRDALEKILVNLIGNALKFTDPGGVVALSAAPSPLGVEIVVTDSGLGIPRDQLERIFDRFAQVDGSATRRHEGTGIGLSLVRELVELHGGRVWAESAGVGHGTQMHVDLALGAHESEGWKESVETSAEPHAGLRRAFDSLAADSGMEAEPEPSGAGEPSAAELPRVLVVEDNADMRRLLSALLSAEFQVRTAGNGREALEVLRGEQPEVILSDVMMPEMSGLELCAALKSDPALRDIPFLLVTSKAEREMRVEGLELGADDYVAKPFHPRELLARVRSFARLRGLQELLTTRNRDLESALGELKQAQSQLVHQAKMAALGQLVAGVAHEINNPVHFIQGNLDFLEESTRSVLAERETLRRRLGEKVDGALEQDMASILGGIREGVARTMRIVEDLRTFSRLDRADVLEIDLPEALDATLHLLSARLGNVEVVREYGPVPRISCLGGQLNQVFMNLIANAIDALGEQGRVCIRTGDMPEQASVFVEVEDDGCGIEAAVLERIFDPFFTTKPVGKGTGLGLSVSHGIVERHGGTIRVTSSVGAGSTFRVEIPVRMQT